jgi:hypothetical protein
MTRNANCKYVYVVYFHSHFQMNYLIYLNERQRLTWYNYLLQNVCTEKLILCNNFIQVLQTCEE